MLSGQEQKLSPRLETEHSLHANFAKKLLLFPAVWPRFLVAENQQYVPHHAIVTMVNNSWTSEITK